MRTMGFCVGMPAVVMLIRLEQGIGVHAWELGYFMSGEYYYEAHNVDSKGWKSLITESRHESSVLWYCIKAPFEVDSRHVAD
jgi:hypothetical protein